MDIERLHAAAKELVNDTQNPTHTSSLLPEGLSQGEPTGEQVLRTLEDLERHERLAPNIQKLHEDILVAEYVFRDTQTIVSLLPSSDAFVRFQSHIAKLLLPSDAFAEQSPFAPEQDVKLQSHKRARLCAIYAVGIRLLSRLRRIGDAHSIEATPELITCLSSFTHAEDPWTNQASQTEASDLLVHYIGTFSSKTGGSQPVLANLLRNFVKPAFAKSKNSAITPAGRKAISTLAPKIEPSIDETKLKPWKYDQVYIVTMFDWVLKQLDASQIENNWPLLIPPLLALLDDAATYAKIRGCSILTAFLVKVPPKLLERTGLGEVFQDALTPCLLYLPELTPESESLQLLSNVYPTLLTMIRVRFADVKDQRLKKKALSNIFRYGILMGYAQAGENVRIAELLVQAMADLVNEMGVASCSHLKHIIPLLCGILVNPFATAYPPLLMVALNAVQCVMANNWPRISYHRSEILRGLVVCWCKVLEDDSPERATGLEQVRGEIRRSVLLLAALPGRGLDIAAEYSSVAASDDRLAQLLAI